MLDTRKHPSRRPRVLLAAYAAKPSCGSEFGVGWNRAVQTARYCDTWVLSEGSLCEAQIRRHLAAHGEIPGLRFVFLRRKPWEWLFEQIPGAWYVSYNLWQRRAYRAARRLHAEIDFDLIHQVTFSGFREPGYLWKLDVPFVWGPVGGTQDYPRKFLPSAGIGGAIRELLRGVLNRLQFRFGRRVRNAAATAAAVLAANSAVQADFQQVHGVKALRMLETGIEQVAAAPSSGGGQWRPFRILWVGRFEHRKALHLLFEALARLPASSPYELRVIGSGPLEARWRRLARRRGIERHTQWLGSLRREEVLGHYHWADVLAFTSLRDTSGNVVLEALSRGVPVIAFDHQGVGDMVTDACGIKIPVVGPRQAVAGLRDAILSLQEDPLELERLSHGALARAREYLWSRQGDRMAALYGQILSGAVVEQHALHAEQGRMLSRSVDRSAAIDGQASDAMPPTEGAEHGLSGLGEHDRLTHVGSRGGGM